MSIDDLLWIDRCVRDHAARCYVDDGRMPVQIPASDAGCSHPRVPIPAFDVEAAATMDAHEVRRRWPRGHSSCPDCGATVISYASASHFAAGDW